ncbi:hypothetical protein GCM10029978_069020 [Actinoallomurus acanthiterrae]
MTTYEEWRDRAARIAPRRELFIDGRFTPTADGGTFATVGPRDGRELAQVAAATETDVDRAVRAARTAFEDGRWAARARATARRCCCA